MPQRSFLMSALVCRKNAVLVFKLISEVFRASAGVVFFIHCFIKLIHGNLPQIRINISSGSGIDAFECFLNQLINVSWNIRQVNGWIRLVKFAQFCRKQSMQI